MARGHFPFPYVSSGPFLPFNDSHLFLLLLVRHVPAWFPGAKFQRIAREWKAINDYLHAKPYNDVKAAMAAGTHHGSITSRLLTTRDDEPLTDEEEDRIMWVVGAIYSGGADTTVSALTTFVLAMVLYPEVQKKAQEEIDRVIGSGRFPSMNDRGSLPYIEAVFKETLRWHPVAPLGVPHRLTKEDQWGGYTLPKGSTIIANIFAMGHTEDDSDQFIPERHLKASGAGEQCDPREYVFGFGRRICPGKDLADAGVWLAIANLIAAFNFAKKPDGKGGFIDVKDDYMPGIISYVFFSRLSYRLYVGPSLTPSFCRHPKPFRCNITPRLSTTAALIRAACAEDAP